MEMRTATPLDYDAIVRLVPSQEELYRVYPMGKYPFTVSQLEELAQVRKELTVVVDKGAVVAFANLYDLEPQQWVFIGNVVVASKYRGKGLGRSLVTHMVHAAFDNYAVPEVRISVFSENTPALLLYAKLGFTPYVMEERQDPGGRRVALIHMKLGRDKLCME